MRRDWDHNVGTAFQFRIEASERLNKEIQDLFERDADDNKGHIPALCDEKLTTYKQVFDFVVTRLVSCDSAVICY